MNTRTASTARLVVRFSAIDADVDVVAVGRGEHVQRSFRPVVEGLAQLRQAELGIAGHVLDPSQDWLDGKQVARVLAVSPGIVWDAIRRGLLPAERQHRRYRVRRGDVTEFLRRSRVTPGTLAALIHRRGGQIGPAAAVKAPGAGETWLSTSQVIEALSLTRSQLYRAIDDGVVPAYRFGRVIRIRQTELDELAASSRGMAVSHDSRRPRGL